MDQDKFVITWLTQNTEKDEIWWQQDGSGFFTRINGFRIDLLTITTRTAPLLCLKFTVAEDFNPGPEEAHIREPLSDVGFRKKFKSKEVQGLVFKLYELRKAVSLQLERKIKYNREHTQEVKQKIFSRLLR